DRLVERQLDPLAARRLPGLARAPVALVERGDDRERVEDPGQVVRDDHARADRRPVGVAGDVEEAAERDAVPVEPRAVAVWPRLYVDRLPSQVEARIERLEIV